MIPVQLYPRKLRAAQGYLTKMPAAFVERWAPLRDLADALARLQDDLATDVVPDNIEGDPKSGFKPKSSDPYEVFIRGGKRIQTRNHERLVRLVGEALIPRGANCKQRGIRSTCSWTARVS